MQTFVLVFLILTIMMSSVVCWVKAECEHPPDAEQQKAQLRNKAFREYLRNGWTWNVIKDYRQNTRENRAKNLRNVNVKQTRISGEPRCWKHKNITQYSDISSKSTCPWYVVMDVDLQREPQAIAKAKCSCRRCFAVDRSSRTRDECTEVNSFIQVVKWRCPENYPQGKRNYFEYFVDIEKVPVGCTCGRPSQV